MASIFTRIIEGEIPCHKLYEDEHTIAILDINPVAPGHCLVIAKAEQPTVEDLSAAQWAAVMETARKVGAAVKAGLGAGAYNLLVNNGKLAGQEVPHLHVHIIPRHEGDGVRFGWKPRALSEPAATVEAIRRALG